jgi:S1-C subfamily serine protease
VGACVAAAHIVGMINFWSRVMSTTDLLSAFSNRLAEIVSQAAPGVVAIEGRRRFTSSGFIWRAGVVVTADEALDTEEDIAVLLPDGRRVAATLAGRDPSTDIAVLRIEEKGIAPVRLNTTDTPLPGHVALAVGRRPEGAIANFGLVSVAGGPWRSMRGGQLDRFIRLDLRLDPRAEGGAVLDTTGSAIGMAVLGPRRSVLAIPATTIERVAEQLIAKGRIARGYLGLGLQPVRLDEALARSLTLPEPRGTIVVSVDPQGPGARAGILLGDVVAKWNGEPVRGVRDVFRRLGPDTVGQTVALTIVRAGQATSANVTIGERPAS